MGLGSNPALILTKVGLGLDLNKSSPNPLFAMLLEILSDKILWDSY